MATWKEAKEPYASVIESIKKVSYPSAVGGDLIIGGAIVANAGPTDPILIGDRSEILSYFTTNGALSSKDDVTLLNAYRLAGSNRLLLCRACSMGDSKYVVGFDKKTNNTKAIVLDGRVLSKMESGMTITLPTDNSDWKVTVADVGTFGNTGDCDIVVKTIDKLVDYLSETPYFLFTGDPTESTEGSKVVNGYAYNKAVLEAKNINISGLPETASNLTNYIINDNNTAGDLKVTIVPYNRTALYDEAAGAASTTEFACKYRITIADPANNGGEYIVAVDKPVEDGVSFLDASDGEISLDEFNAMNGLVTIVAPEGLDKVFDIDTLATGWELNEDGNFYHMVNGENDLERTINVKIQDGDLIDLSGDANKVKKISALQKAIDKVVDDERFIVEALSDLGENDFGYMNYISGKTQLNSDEPINSNYSYVPSGPKSTNYMIIANGFDKLAKGYNSTFITPWDEDSGTLGFKFDVSPSTLYWEGVARNKSINNEFAAMFGQTNGIVTPVKLIKKFGKKERQMLLGKRINTIFEDIAQGATYINDNLVSIKTEDIMDSENNNRLRIRINKAIPQLLSKFKGEPSNYRTWKEAREAVEYWLKSVVMTWNYTIEDYKVICDSTNNTAETIRQHKLVMRVMARYPRSIKYITIYSDAYDIGVEFE